jgi:hypothetical protein
MLLLYDKNAFYLIFAVKEIFVVGKRIIHFGLVLKFKIYFYFFKIINLLK